MAGGWQMMETTQSGTWKLHQTEHLWRFSYSTPWGPRWGGVRPNNQTLEIKTQYWNAFNANMVESDWSTRNHSYIVKRRMGKQKTLSDLLKNFYFVSEVLVSAGLPGQFQILTSAMQCLVWASSRWNCFAYLIRPIPGRDGVTAELQRIKFL